ncbi:hypothetical protein [Lacihabitans sp. CS3-21]|uniref:hypothetical protein n=1 Tax=Lacihabitans sp. CS3-21 TaxID=2487332 RepID=UPI0020CFDF64|nr:hypothetical protein [Lacihabitans sp. CS3-21]MCP9745537.1 hypothetical protein [Lacihabitans sp. CS3-21]
MKLKFIEPTIIFSIAGFFIPGFTVIVIIGFQMLLVLLGLECTTAWRFTWFLTILACVICPFLFFSKIVKSVSLENYEKVKKQLLLFNIFEYVMLQSSLSAFYSNPKTLCNVGDGQNGLELIFTGWLALPILIAISFIFEKLIDLD